MCLLKKGDQTTQMRSSSSTNQDTRTRKLPRWKNRRSAPQRRHVRTIEDDDALEYENDGKDVSDEELFLGMIKKTTTVGQVIKACDRPRSYQILTDRNTVIERNRKDLYKGSPDNDSDSVLENDVCTNDVANHAPTGKELVKTRSGRVVKRPTQFEDYH
ncbi:unnamed protein product, partial [Nesidiocoris tenuis]